MISKIIDKIKAIRSTPKIAVINFTGVIGRVGGMRSGFSLEDVEDNIEKAFNSKNIKQVAIVINSPGGSPVQSELIFNKIRRMAKEKNLQVTSFAEDVAASGGYWLLCAGDELYASSNSIIGSIGVISSGFGLHEAIKKMGIERRVYQQGENKSLLDPFMPEKKEDVEILTKLQADVHESFKSLVRNRRGNKLNGDGIFSGEFWSGKKALEMGLIDGIADMEELMQERYGTKVKLIKISQQKSWLKQKLSINILEEIAASTIWQRFGL